MRSGWASESVGSPDAAVAPPLARPCGEDADAPAPATVDSEPPKMQCPVRRAPPVARLGAVRDRARSIERRQRAGLRTAPSGTLQRGWLCVERAAFRRALRTRTSSPSGASRHLPLLRRGKDSRQRVARRPPRRSRPEAACRYSVFCSTITNSTRRFLSHAAATFRGSTGCVSPKPWLVSRAASTPLPSR
jgi:hypothetical protein